MNGKKKMFDSLILFFFFAWRDKHRDREHKDHKSSHRDKDKHHSSSSKSGSGHDHRHKERESKKSLENGVVDQQQLKPPPIKVEQDVVEVKEEVRDPLDTSNCSFSETNVIQANGIRECFVNVSQISNSSCDYSLSQFRADESAFSTHGGGVGLAGDGYDDESRDVGDYDQGDTGENGRNNGDDDDDDYNGGGGDDADSDDEIPIAKRKKINAIKRELSDDDDDVPLTARKKPKTEAKKAKKIKREPSDEDDEDDYDKPKKKKIKKEKVQWPPSE